MTPFDIKSYTLRLRANLLSRFDALKNDWIQPKIADICVGDDESIESYIRIKSRLASELWVELIVDRLSAYISQEDLHRALLARSTDPRIQWIILESPLPDILDYNLAISQIDPNKDIDGLHPKNLGRLINNTTDDWLIPATPLAILRVLEQLFTSLKWIDIVIIGSGRTVGKPLANILMSHESTVTICNHYSKDLAAICKKAKVIITAAGEENLITSDMVTSESVIIDVGQNYSATKWKMVGDADYDTIAWIVEYITPVPGGIGPVTNAMIFENLLQCVSLKIKADPFENSMNYYIEQARSAHMPGGGSIAAMSAIEAASMINMVFALTKDAEVEVYKSQITEIIDTLKTVYQHDMNVFNDYLFALKLPKETEEQKTVRSRNIQAALCWACDVPLSLAENCIKILMVSKESATIGNPHALSDVLVGTNLAVTAAESALASIDLNVRSIKDMDFCSLACKKRDKLLKDIHDLSSQIKTILASR